MSTSLAPDPLSRDSLHRLVHSFYADVRRDPLLTPVFDSAIGPDWHAHLARMVDFWATLMLDARSFSGNVYGTHMRLEGVEPAHFERWMTLWYEHTENGFQPADRQRLRDTAEMIGRSLFLGFFGSSVRFRKDGAGGILVDQC
ncbi:MAG: group III truncated hemoglobin [Rhodocyclaceae bacterium]